MPLQKGFVKILLLLILAVGILFSGLLFFKPELLESLITTKPVPEVSNQKSPDNAQEVVEIVHKALKDSDWETLFEYSLLDPDSGVTKEEFVTDFAKVEDNTGRVIETEILSSPDIQLKSPNQWIFSVNTKITYDKKGNIETYGFEEYYGVENNEWKFWYSTLKQ